LLISARQQSQHGAVVSNSGLNGDLDGGLDSMTAAPSRRLRHAAYLRDQLFFCNPHGNYYKRPRPMRMSLRPVPFLKKIRRGNTSEDDLRLPALSND
jgi:hypothetical protein